jgi:archaellum component FlaC
MERKIIVRDTLTDSIKYFPKVNNKLQELQTLMESIENQLNESQWTGESRDKCRYIHQAIRLYYCKIIPLCDELKMHVEKLDKDANNFCGQSENVTMIKSI